MKQLNGIQSYKGENMQILFTANGSVKMGLGHIFRCRTIADELIKINPNIKIFFISNANNKLKNTILKGYICLNPKNDNDKIANLIKNSDMIISDILNTSNKYISQVKYINPDIKIVCIDNNTNLKLIKDADYVFNANIFNKENFTNNKTSYFLGPQYMILNKKIKNLNNPNFNENKIFVCFGGSDAKRYTINTINALKQITPALDLHVDIVIGPLFENVPEIEKLSEDTNICIHKNPNNIIKLMSRSFIAIISAGIILYEICAMGIPSLVIPQVEHQEKIAEEFSKNDACINLKSNASQMDVNENLKMLLKNQDMQIKLSKSAKNFVDGDGLNRFIEIILDD